MHAPAASRLADELSSEAPRDTQRSIITSNQSEIRGTVHRITGCAAQLDQPCPWQH